jgi:hypothetical protein
MQLIVEFHHGFPKYQKVEVMVSFTDYGMVVDLGSRATEENGWMAANQY